MDKLGIERAGFVGHDVGAFAMQRLALNHPDKVAGLFFFNCATHGVGPRWREPKHINEIWYQTFHQMPFAPAIVGASRELLPRLFQLPAEALVLSQGCLRRRAGALGRQLHASRQSARRLQLVHLAECRPPRRHGRHRAQAAQDHPAGARAVGAARSGAAERLDRRGGRVLRKRRGRHRGGCRPLRSLRDARSGGRGNRPLLQADRLSPRAP